MRRYTSFLWCFFNVVKCQCGETMSLQRSKNSLFVFQRHIYFVKYKNPGNYYDNDARTSPE